MQQGVVLVPYTTLCSFLSGQGVHAPCGELVHRLPAARELHVPVARLSAAPVQA